MKVAIVHNTYRQPGGEDAVVAEETRLLESHGHKVVSYRRGNHELDGMSKPKLLLQVKDVVHSTSSKHDVRELIRAEKPDIVHIHNTFLMISPSAYEACEEEGVPVVQTLHNFRLLCPGGTFNRAGFVCEECIGGNFWSGIRHGCYRDSSAMTSVVALMLKFHQFQGTWNRSINRYVALSEFARSKFIQGGLPADKIHVKPNFLGMDPGQKSGPGKYALFVGRLSPEKGVDILLSAWSQLRSPLPLMIVGDGPLRESLNSRVSSLGLKDVTIRSWCPRDEVLAAMKSAAFVVMPSTWYEGFPLTIIESFACGTPVICSRLGSMQEIVEDGCTGLHFNPGDSADLASKIDLALAKTEYLDAMGRAARRRYEKLYTAERNYTKLMDIYEQTIATRARK
jgi:glycosyltransferase involved in cell wall biosynthesis